ncbi:hypothetical protein BCV70DRAFT_144415, partial [Testicularia cyperi]
VFDAGHGAGEVIRGNINDTLDSAGEGLRKGTSEHDSSATTTATGTEDIHGRSSDYNHAGSHQGVAQNGANEFHKGLDRLTGALSGNSSSANTNT